MAPRAGRLTSNASLLASLAVLGVGLLVVSRGSESQAPPGPAESAHVHLGPDGRLIYLPYSNGDTIPDFSNAGYAGGGVALPSVPVQRTVSPVAGDDGAAIQAAIDAVSALAPDADGFRGAVLLEAGRYEVADSVTIRASGVVLRGEGDGPDGTVIKATGTSRRSLINVTGVGDRVELAGTAQSVSDAYVPVGAVSFAVADASAFSVGDDVLVVRTPNQEWIDALGMDACTTLGTVFDTSDVDGLTCISESFWKPTDRVMRYERRITAISGNQVSLDAPVVEAIQAEFGGGYLVRYQFPGRIRGCGVEFLRADSDFASDADEEHATRMIALSNVEDAWVRRVTSVHFEQGTVLVSAGARFVTVQDSASLDHKSQITGGRRYPFSLDDASFVLVMRCLARTGRHDYVTGSNTPGPNVFLDSQGLDSRSELGPHHRWATGSLFDLIRHESFNRAQIMGTYNRGNSGSGHGWSGAYQLFWNCVGDTHRVASPPFARNWSIGCQTLRQQGDGEFESYSAPVVPSSLYLAQLRDRLGETALANIGYASLPPLPAPPAPVPTPTPTPTPAPTPPAVIFEAENTPFTTSGPTTRPSPDPGASNGIWVQFFSEAPGDWIEYTLENVPRGTYDVVFKYKTNPNRGIHDLAFDGVLLNGTLDQFKTGAGTFPEKNFGTLRFGDTGSHLVRLSVVGKRPAAGSFSISADRLALVPDVKSPTLMIPGDLTAEAAGPEGAAISFEVTAVDDKDGPVPVVLSPPSGSTFPLGTTAVLATAADFAGNQASKSFEVSVGDTTPPALVLPSDLSFEATGADGAPAFFAATAHDLVSGDVPVIFSRPSGSLFPLGETAVTAGASDSFENETSGVFNVSVVDTTPPALTLPAELVLEATGPEGAVATFSAGARDIVNGDVEVSLNPASGTLFPLGSTSVSASATDAAGNTAHGSFSVTVRDGTAPDFQSLTASPAVLWPPNHKLVRVGLTAAVVDTVDPAPVTRIVSVASNEPEGGTGAGDRAPDWEILCDLSLKLRAERAPHGRGRIYTVSVESRDRFGNASTMSVTVSVPKQR